MQHTAYTLYDINLAESEETGNFLKYNMVVEYNHRPPLPSPLTILIDVYQILRILIYFCLKRRPEGQVIQRRVPLRMQRITNSLEPTKIFNYCYECEKY